MGGNHGRRPIGAMALGLAAGVLTAVAALSALSPAASAATSARLPAAPGSPGSFGVQLVDVPVSEANNPRALRYIIDDLPTGTVIHRRILIVNNEPHKARFTVYPAAAHITDAQLRTLLLDCLKLWEVKGKVTACDTGLAIETPNGVFTVARADAELLPERWFYQTPERAAAQRPPRATPRD